MLGESDAAATIAVKDIAVSREFYEGKLGLKPVSTDQPGVITYTSGSSRILVYESRYAGTNQATAATWMAGDDVGLIVRSLREKGVAFEHYDLPNTTRDGDVHVFGDLRVAWFKDPDGNILSLVSG